MPPFLRRPTRKNQPSRLSRRQFIGGAGVVVAGAATAVAVPIVAETTSAPTVRSPYTVDVTDRLRAGENTIAVHVPNTGFCALRASTGLSATVEAVSRIDGRRFHMQDMELAQQPTTSGMREIPTLRFRYTRDPRHS